MKNAKHYQSNPFIFRGEVIGFKHVFDFDIEITTDLNGEVIDYSNCGFNTAKRLIENLKNK